MKEIFKSKYKNIFLAGLAFTIICAWFSVGFYHADEQNQVIEFCNYKMGHISGNDLPWEFQQKVRATLLPDIAYTIAKIISWCGLYNPFTFTFLLRLFSGVFAWFITCRFCLLLYPKFKISVGQRIFILMSLLLWFVPYLSVRFTAENVSGVIFLYGVYFIFKDLENNSHSVVKYAFAGLFIGFSFFIRPQMIFAIFGIIAWLLIVKKIKWKYALILAMTGSVAIGMNVLLDYWFYGQPVFTPFNYYYANVIQHKAASFGINPWWFYFPEFIMKAVPPISILLLIFFMAGIIKNPRNMFVWIIVPFIIMHCFTPHKELRFLFPMMFVFIYISAMGLDYFLEQPNYQKIHNYVYKILLVLCIPLLIYRTIAPAQGAIYYYKYLYENIPVKTAPIFILHNDYDNQYALNVSFYKIPDVKTITVDSTKQIEGYLADNHPISAYFISKQTMNYKWNITGYKTIIAYCLYPSWILQYDINKWEERTQIWSIYQFDKVQ